MQKFELCFTLDAGFEKKYLIPDLLPKEEPYFNWPKPNDCLLFQYSYHVLPSSVISRFIVRIQAYIPRNAYWRTGTILAYQNNQALVKADLEDAKITISVVGEKNTRREFLAIIRSNLDHIHRTIPRIEAKAQVSIPNYPGIAVDYQHLLTLEQLGQETFIPSGLSELINVKFLLDGVDAQKEGELRSVPTNLQILSQLRSFIASAFDEEELRDLCFDLNVAYDDLGGRGKAGNVRELIAYLERRDRLSDLFHILQESRPHIDWPQI
jgi:internalin A